MKREKRYYHGIKRRGRSKNGVKSLTLTAMLIAMSVAVGIFCKTFLNFGNGLFRITFENFPIIISGLVFGPVIGGLVGLESDIISYLASGQAYPLNPIVTLGAVLIGVISGLVPRLIIKKRGKLQIIVATSLSHLIGSVAVKSAGLFLFYGWGILFRIPTYAVIIAAEAVIICLLFKNGGFRRLVDEVSKTKRSKQ